MVVVPLEQKLLLIHAVCQSFLLTYACHRQEISEVTKERGFFMLIHRGRRRSRQSAILIFCSLPFVRECLDTITTFFSSNFPPHFHLTGSLCGDCVCMFFPPRGGLTLASESVTGCNQAGGNAGLN
jgi:hypothetical protein